MQLKKVVPVISLVVVLTLLAACGKKTAAISSGTGDDGKYGYASLAFSNANNTPLGFKGFLQKFLSPNYAYAASLETPTTFKMKLIAAYLSEDITENLNNSGQTSMFYMNPECMDDIRHCNAGPGNDEDGNPFQYVIQEKFDFAQDSATVNAALNSQNRKVKVGTYKYVRVEFCKYGVGGVPNLTWAGGQLQGEADEITGGCGVDSVEISPALEIKEGDEVEIQLAYDYSQAIQVGADAIGHYCRGEGSSKTCFSIPQFVPSVQ